MENRDEELISQLIGQDEELKTLGGTTQRV